MIFGRLLAARVEDFFFKTHRIPMRDLFLASDSMHYKELSIFPLLDTLFGARGGGGARGGF